ncbi:hypothetical protein [Salinibacillus xinjiangensis]|uniref:Uncharacterized protein n=1 Tax=Salinibacillus xinjiangensis TaxID=1229268 RepID=A0A6G1X4Z4_9BACI|nr:hypothetical protein [Salinibacillus xinjiangensis]MRG86034.1 hypothetical protein [Salinibacillus xinjiangensis]
MHQHEIIKRRDFYLKKMQEAQAHYNHCYHSFMYFNQLASQPYLQFNPYTQVNPHLEVNPQTQINPNLEVNPQTQVNPNVEVSPETSAYFNFDPDFNLNVGNNWK